MDVRNILGSIVIYLLISQVYSHLDQFEPKNYWELFDYNIDGVIYTNDTDYEHKVGTFYFEDENLEENEKFLIRKNLVPYGIVHLYLDLVISIPRTRHGIPFSLNAVSSVSWNLHNLKPVITPFPSTKESKNIISVYDMERDGCRRIWMVDTGFIDIPGFRKQVQEPMVLSINTEHRVIMVKEKIGPQFLRDGVTSGLRTIALDYIYPCSETFMYINDDHSNSVIVFSVKDLSFRRIQRPNIRDEAWTFPVPSIEVVVKFLMDLILVKERDKVEESIVNYMKHVVRSRKLPSETFVEYSKYLETTIADQEKLRSDANLSERSSNPRGVLYERSPSHDVLLFTNEDRTHLYCWNVDTPMIEENIELLMNIPENMTFYIADLDTSGNSFHVIVNNLRSSSGEDIYYGEGSNFVYISVLLHKLLANTKCSERTECTDFLTKWTEDHHEIEIGHIKYTIKYATEEFKQEWKNNRETIRNKL